MQKGPEGTLQGNRICQNTKFLEQVEPNEKNKWKIISCERKIDLQAKSYTRKNVLSGEQRLGSEAATQPSPGNHYWFSVFRTYTRMKLRRLNYHCSTKCKHCKVNIVKAKTQEILGTRKRRRSEKAQCFDQRERFGQFNNPGPLTLGKSKDKDPPLQWRRFCERRS